MKVIRAILPCLLSLPWLASTAPQSGKPNILFIITDQQFADALNCVFSRGNQRESLVDMQAEPGDVARYVIANRLPGNPIIGQEMLPATTVPTSTMAAVATMMMMMAGAARQE